MKKKAILHNSLASLSNFAFTAITSIVLLPYYFKFIDKEMYGIWLGGISFLMLFSVFEANIALILTQKLGQHWIRQEKDKFAKFLFAALFLGVVFTFFITITTFFLKEPLANWVSNDKIVILAFSWCFFLYAISIAFGMVSSFLGAISQVFLKTFYPPFFNILSSICGVLYTVFAVSSQGVMAIAIGALIKSVVYLFLLGTYSAILIRNEKISYSYNYEYVKKLLLEIKWPFVSKVGVTLAVNVQNFIVALAISASATTIFDVTRKFPFITIMVINMFTAATFTSFSLFYTENKNSDENNKLTRVYFSLIKILLFITLFLVFMLGKETIILWVGLDKFGGDLLLGVLCIAAFFDQLRLTLSQQYYALGKFKLTSITDIIFAASFIITLACLLPFFKLYGLVFAGICANLVYFIGCRYFEKKHNINLVSQIISKNLFMDLLFVIALGTISKLIFNEFNFQIMYQIVATCFAFLLFLYYLYIKERLVLKLVGDFFMKKIKP